MKIDDVLRYIMAFAEQDRWNTRMNGLPQDAVVRLLMKLRVVDGVGALRSVDGERCGACGSSNRQEDKYVAFMESK